MRIMGGASALRLLHYWWPLVLGWSLTVVVQRATGKTADVYGVATLLLGIFAAYNLDRVIDPPQSGSGGWMTRLLAVSGVISAVGCGLAALKLPVETSALVPAPADDPFAKQHGPHRPAEWRVPGRGVPERRR